MQTRPILVIGATGRTGRRIARRLAAQGQAVRHGARGAALPFDRDRPESRGPALDGRNARLGDGVRRAPGRLARDSGAFCAREAAAGAWSAAA